MDELLDEELFGPGHFSDSELEVDNMINGAESHENGSQISSNNEPQKTVFPSIPGLFLYKNLLTQEQQNRLVDAIINEGYFERPESNQAMCFATDPNEVISVILRPGDVLAMSGPARYDWAHGIEATKIDIVGNERIVRK
ncbi:17314_t:CDS:2, partial [Racocetra fulgida]